MLSIVLPESDVLKAMDRLRQFALSEDLSIHWNAERQVLEIQGDYDSDITLIDEIALVVFDQTNGNDDFSWNGGWFCTIELNGSPQMLMICVDESVHLTELKRLRALGGLLANAKLGSWKVSAATLALTVLKKSQPSDLPTIEQLAAAASVTDAIGFTPQGEAFEVYMEIPRYTESMFFICEEGGQLFPPRFG